jgi:hypothetical protein
MRHYHGTPIGGTRAAADEFAERRHILIPWKRPEDLGRAMKLSRGFMVDNSAFTYWSTGESPDWDEYATWCLSFARHPRFDFAIIPDVIDGDEPDNDGLIRMWSEKCCRVSACPVWHLHESLDRLKRLCQQWERVALGSSGQWPTPGVDSWQNRMDDAFDAICDEDGFPLARIHGLRMLRGDIVQRYPFASCDSTNAAQNGTREAGKNGVDSLWGKTTIARRMELVQSPSRWVRGEVQGEFELIG